MSMNQNTWTEKSNGYNESGHPLPLPLAILSFGVEKFVIWLQVQIITYILVSPHSIPYKHTRLHIVPCYYH